MSHFSKSASVVNFFNFWPTLVDFFYKEDERNCVRPCDLALFHNRKKLIYILVFDDLSFFYAWKCSDCFSNGFIVDFDKSGNLNEFLEFLEVITDRCSSFFV
jgi:hypothetical protein